MASWGILMLVMVLSMCVTSLATSFDNLPEFSLSDFGELKPGKINDNIDSLLQKFGSALPSKVDLGTIDRNFAYNCFMTGLDHGIYREGDAYLDIPDLTAIFTFGLSTHRLTVQCYWRKKLLLLSFGGLVRAHTNKVSVQANMTLEIAPGAAPKIERFGVTYMDRIYTDVRGAGLLNWIGEKILNNLVNASKARIIREIEQDLSKRLQDLLQAFKLPSLN